MRIGIYGGTFNPPHIGHVHAAAEAGRVLQLDKLLVIPDNVPPHKAIPTGSPNSEQRLEMARLAFGEIPCAEVSELELCREGESFSSDTVQQVQAMYPDAELWLLMGSDMLETFHLWHEPEVITRFAKLATFVRGDAGEQEMFDRMIPLLKNIFHADVTLISMEALKASSTEVRRAISHGKAEQFLTEAVWGYIQREHLYETNVDLKHLSPEQLRPIALSYLKHKRMPHVLGTEEEAIRLAQHYGADINQARIAALLHDCTKKLDMQQQMVLCKKYHIALDPLEQKALKLLHAKTGAEIAKDVFGVDEAVYEAIKWHTTGKADMTLLEKIVYLADYIEPTRDFPGVNTLRKTVYEDLNAGLALGLEMTIEEMKKMGNPVHEKTLEALRFLKG